MLNYQTVDFLADQLRQQYEQQVAAGLDPYPYQEQLPKFFRAQAAKLAANNVRSIYDVQQQDGNIINAATNEPIKDVVLRPSWETDPEAYKFRDTVELEERGGGKYTRWGKDLSVTGQGDYGLTFVDNKPVFTPYWKDTQNFSVEDAVKTAAAIAAIYYGGQYLLAEGGAAAGAGAGTGAAAGTTAATSTAVPGSFQAALPSLGVNTAATTAASTAIPGSFQAALPGLLASTAGGAPIYFANAVPAGEVAYPATQVGAGATPVPGSLQARLGELGVQTAATTAPATAAAGSFQAALPSLLSNTAATTGVLDTLRTANAVRNMLTQPTVQQQAGLLGSGGGGQARGVDFSPLYQNTVVGLLPLAERYRRSLI